jgi:NAD+ synthase
VPAAEVARAINLTEEQVSLVWQDIAAKRKATRYLHQPPLLIGEDDIGHVA